MMDNINLNDYEQLMAIVDAVSPDGYVYILAGYDPVYKELISEAPITKDQFNNLYNFADERDSGVDYLRGHEYYKLDANKMKTMQSKTFISIPDEFMEILWYIEKIKQ